MASDINDIDPIETQEWLDALNAVMMNDGHDRAQFLLKSLINKAQAEGCSPDLPPTTPYRNTIKAHEEKPFPHDEGMGRRIAALIRWNAVAMVLRGGKYASELGGHIASYASAATLYEVGFNYFFSFLVAFFATAFLAVFLTLATLSPNDKNK